MSSLSRWCCCLVDDFASLCHDVECLQAGTSAVASTSTVVFGELVSLWMCHQEFRVEFLG